MLNPPNIAAIYGFEKSGRTHDLVMELVEGDDLSRRIARGARGETPALSNFAGPGGVDGEPAKKNRTPAIDVARPPACRSCEACDPRMPERVQSGFRNPEFHQERM